MNCVIIKYNAGNIHSVRLACRRLGIEPFVTDDPHAIRGADRVIFPGVGEASSAMKYLKACRLDNVIRELTQPVLGICLGLQLMCRFSEEGRTMGLGIFDADVKLFPPEDKVPHMGWNNIDISGSKLFSGVPDGSHMYFVHSYCADICEQTIARTNYILPFSAALKKDNFSACQFHPEKSGRAGERILKNFIKGEEQ